MSDSTLNKNKDTMEAARLKNDPLYILGPCSAESKEQIVTTAKAISTLFPKAIFRAGIWKPRTRPNNFEGIGEKGLSWLQDVQKETGLRVATEVANANHVDLCLKAGIDVLWIGARTTVNPFYVQEIAEALRGVNIPVYIKNPVAPDLNLWLGAIERLEKLGISEICAIHRGFQSYDSKPFRNQPQWEIPIELMAKRPDVPIYCDISHICGNPNLFHTTAQKAMDLNMAGLHIEVHPNPKAALSDADQQITVEELNKLIQQLEFRQVTTDDADYLKLLDQYRDEIDNVDEKLIKNIYKRIELVKKIGELKKENQITILQVNRWKTIVEHYLAEGKVLGINETFLKDILNSIHDESMRTQHEIMNKIKE